MGPVGWVALILVVIGGLNWGLVALGFNLVDAIFGVGSILAKIIYGLVGISALVVLVGAFMKKSSAPAQM